MSNRKFQFPRGNVGGDNRNSKLGTAKWLKATTIYQSGSIWLGRNEDGDAIGVNDDRHVITFAGTRAGKGTSCTIPNLCLWVGSAVIVDPKGENAARTARERAKKPGHKVIALDPYNEAKLPKELLGSYNPLDLIDIESDDAIDLAGMIADSMIVVKNDKDSHWDESARDLIAALILHVCDTEELELRHLGRVRQLLTKGDPEFRDALIAEGASKKTNAFDALWACMAATEATNENIADEIIGIAESIIAMGDNERGSVLSTSRRNTRFLGTPRIRKVLSSTSFDIDELKTSSGGMSLYLCLPARAFPTKARFLRLIISLIFFRMEEIGLEEPACGHPVLFLLDEFASLGHMEMLEKAAGLMAGYGIKLWPILQDMTQLKKHYRDSYETFVANAGTVMCFANTDLTTLEWLSKRTGETEIIRENKGSSLSNSKGLSTAKGTSASEGSSNQYGQSTTQADMAPLSETATIQGGQSLWDVLSRRFQRSTAYSYGNSHNQGSSNQTSTSNTVTGNESETHGTSRQEQIIKTPLMTTDEIASYFDRDSGRAISFIGGHGPYAIHRTPYFEDEQFKGLFTEEI